MPLTGGRKSRQEPFNYTRACYEVGGWLFGVFMLVVFVFFQPPQMWILFSGFLVCALFIVFAKTVGWQWLGEDLRAQIPYDASESDKGTIHSYGDLWRYLHRRHEM